MPGLSLVYGLYAPGLSSWRGEVAQVCVLFGVHSCVLCYPVFFCFAILSCVVSCLVMCTVLSKDVFNSDTRAVHNLLHDKFFAPFRWTDKIKPTKPKKTK